MTEQMETSVLRRMLAEDEPVAAEVPLTIARALRLSMARAAEASVQLKLSVDSVLEDGVDLDAALEKTSNDDLLIRLERHNAPLGIATFDTGLVAAIVESQTIGRLLDRVPDPRPMTSVDTVLAQPLLDSLLAEITKTVVGTALEPWVLDVVQGKQFVDCRQIGLTLPQADYRYLTINVDFGVAGRKGQINLVLPRHATPVAPKKDESETLDWATAFPETVGLSEAVLPVVLHRFETTLDKVSDLVPGQVMTIPGCRVDRARLMSPDGAVIGRGRLGQMGGHLALRLEPPSADMLEELSGGAAPAVAPPPMPEAPAIGMDVDMPSSELELDLTSVGSAEEGLMAGDVELDAEQIPDVPSGDLGDMDLSSLGGEQEPEVDLSGLGGLSDDGGGEIDLDSIDLSKL